MRTYSTIVSIFTTAILIIFCCLQFGCESTTEPKNVLPSLQLTADQLQITNSTDAFGLKLFREITKQESEPNIFISPLSVSMALSMTANGAAGTTFDSMRATLELGDMTEEQSNAASNSLIDLLTGADPKVQLDIANAIFYLQELTFLDDFYQRCSDFFNAAVEGLDFSSDDAVITINNWVDENTNGKIEEIIEPPIDRGTVMFLLNAIYLKGTWTYEFEPEDTEDDLFTIADGSQVACKMMEREADLPYLSSERFQAVDLPYGAGIFSMTVLLPEPDVSVDDLITDMTTENWSAWINALGTAGIRLQLPKFKIDYELAMEPVLTSLGMGVAFGGGADFSRMHATAQLFISKVTHKSFVEVNEEGTEAAAVTVVEIVWTSIGDDSPRLFRVDRPFVFAIRERSSGAILFIGKIGQPE
ncbi:serpin family protein [Candidatus Neomarinimicrobiota bacterium]